MLKTLKTILIMVAALILGSVPQFVEVKTASASPITQRSVTLGTSASSATTEHLFSMFLPSITTVGSIEFEYCSNSPIPNEPCVAPVGFDLSSAAMSPADQTGEVGFDINPSTFDSTYPDDNVILIDRPTSLVTPQQVSYTFRNLVNPSANGTFYVRIYTYEEENGRNSLPSATLVDEGSVAASTASGVQILADVPPYLTFCVGVVIFSHDCSTAAGNQISLGTFANDSTATGSSKFTAFTNALFGYSVSVLGTTMTSGNNIIPPINPRNNSNINTNQFGLNLRANSSPNIGLEPNGPGTATPTADYNIPNQFKFASGNNLVNSPVPSSQKTFTVSYIVNINDNQPKGIYSTTLTYVATATF